MHTHFPWLTKFRSLIGMHNILYFGLILLSEYWQLPVHPDDNETTAFCPGLGLGLFQFGCMPFGLTGAPGSFQRLMNKIFRGLQFVTTYIDDVLIHSINREMHKTQLEQIFQRIKEAGLTLKGCKCRIGKDEVIYLGHVFLLMG